MLPRNNIVRHWHYAAIGSVGQPSWIDATLEIFKNTLFHGVDFQSPLFLPFVRFREEKSFQNPGMRKGTACFKASKTSFPKNVFSVKYCVMFGFKWDNFWLFKEGTTAAQGPAKLLWKRGTGFTFRGEFPRVENIHITYVCVILFFGYGGELQAFSLWNEFDCIHK